MPISLLGVRHEILVACSKKERHRFILPETIEFTEVEPVFRLQGADGVEALSERMSIVLLPFEMGLVEICVFN